MTLSGRPMASQGSPVQPDCAGYALGLPYLTIPRPWTQPATYTIKSVMLQWEEQLGVYCNSPSTRKCKRNTDYLTPGWPYLGEKKNNKCWKEWGKEKLVPCW
jgi:hypothetical protein